MAFFDKIGKKIGDVAGTAADKAKDLAETTKLNAAISTEEKQIHQYYLEIGKTMFELEKNNPDSPVAEFVQKILASQQTIAELKDKIIEIKEDKDSPKESEEPLQQNKQAVSTPTSGNDVGVQNICPNCQTDNPENSKFCRNCGTPLPSKE
ncbi:hypothetical protein Desdi_0208 [Desulfitobacterium dichloroeliminans LMG P-21439]|uniref:Zinc-ribbon domain-containing protein n=1 Tax=Desulfitobacterium dichloroeliminans (strain LMG P-21439 / DCA1) TaxID=871963 RepID=L0F3K5_DESDL|nr:zinc ribbon domain-containing protein [Desulfitobacterium dichloroeliminans]AGA67762.1 hypothetical protein Desdi_0208 [Desulfitobacterium dichloroeliminans LMG P-21439]